MRMTGRPEDDNDQIPLPSRLYCRFGYGHRLETDSYPRDTEEEHENCRSGNDPDKEAEAFEFGIVCHFNEDGAEARE